MAIDGPEVLLVEKHHDEHYAVVTVNRPERGNSFNMELTHRLDDTWQELQSDDEVWAIVLTAVGDRFFCAGEDLKDRADIDLTYEGGFVRYLEVEGFGKIDPFEHELWKPIIGAINGVAVAGGFYLAQLCDVRIASDQAMFGIPEVRWNLPAGFAAPLQRMIPSAIALEMVMFGSRLYSAQRMYEVGFVNKVVPAEQVLGEAVAWAKEVCEMGPVSVWTHKELMYRYLYQDKAWADRFSLAMFDKVGAMEDSVEGPAAFAEKRRPEWKLR